MIARKIRGFRPLPQEFRSIDGHNRQVLLVLVLVIEIAPLFEDEDEEEDEEEEEENEKERLSRNAL